MSAKNIQSIKPFLSVVILIATLFIVVFFKMEKRRLNYSLIKIVRTYDKLSDNYQLKKIKYARYSRLERVRNYAITKLTLRDAEKGQIIQMTGNNIAITQ